MFRIRCTASILVIAFGCFTGTVPGQEKKDEEPTFRGRTLTEWRKDLKDSDREVKRKAAIALSQMKAAAKPAVPDLADVLKDPDAQVRLLAVTALWQIGSDATAATPAVLRAFKDEKEDAKVRTMAAYALGKFGPAQKDVLPALNDALRGDDVGLRRTCAFVLGTMGAEAKVAVPNLIHLSRDPDDLTSRAAAMALKKIDPDAAAKSGIK